MNDKEKERLDIVIELLSTAISALDIALRQFVEVAETLAKEDQVRVAEAIRMVLDHLRSSVKDAEFSLIPVPDHSKEYNR